VSLVWHHSRRRRIPPDPSAAFGSSDQEFDAAPPPAFDRPTGAANVVATSPVTNTKYDNDQEMQSGSDEMTGVHDSSISGGDYSNEQGVGRAPGFRWPFNFNSQAFNLQSLDRWNVERSDAVALPGGLNPYEGVPEPPYSPIASIDQTTMFYERSPDQGFWLGPGPITMQDVNSPAYTEQAILGAVL
jgi:hypothetical protein